LSVVVGFYRVCVIDQILPHSPADYVRRPPVPADSPTLGPGHLQFEVLITAARLSANPNDFALVALLGLLGLHMLRHTFVTTMLDAGVSLRDVQIAARHADPRTTMRYDRARKNLDRHPNYVLAAYMASGT
jgi:integrase